MGSVGSLTFHKASEARFKVTLFTCVLPGSLMSFSTILVERDKWCIIPHNFLRCVSFVCHAKSDGAAFRFRRRHQLADRIKNNLELRIVLLFKFVQSPG